MPNFDKFPPAANCVIFPLIGRHLFLLLRFHLYVLNKTPTKVLRLWCRLIYLLYITMLYKFIYYMFENENHIFYWNIGVYIARLILGFGNKNTLFCPRILRLRASKYLRNTSDKCAISNLIFMLSTTILSMNKIVCDKVNMRKY